MRKHGIITRILNKYFNKDLDIQVQTYNLLMFIGIAFGISATITAIFVLDKKIAVIADLMIAATGFIMLRAAEKKKNFHFCVWITILAVFMIMFPVLFFYCGGYKSGMASLLICALIITSFFLKKRELAATLILEFSIYLSCFLVSYYRPGTAVALSSEFNCFLSVLLNFMYACAILLTVTMMYNRMFRIRHEQIRELNRELSAKNEALARYDNMKSDFLAAVAHEIGAPLAVISASSGDTLDLLKESSQNMDDIEENQVIIGEKVKLIDRILLDLMDNVAIETGRLSLNHQSVNLSGLIKNICGVQHEKLNANNNRVTYDLPMDMPQIWVDPPRIEQVMTNLLSNAFRHTRNGIITVKLTRADNRQTVSVKDNGAGMDEETAKSALKQYVSTKADYWRHGIGLHLCRRIIAAHGGDIWIESEKGRGTAVYFTIEEKSG